MDVKAATPSELKARAHLLGEEIEANSEENRMMQNEIDQIEIELALR